MPTPSPLIDPEESALNASVQRCCQAWHHSLATDPKPDTYSCEKRAAQAYRNAMPFLTSPANIDAFVACVAHGMLLGAIPAQDASKLLYAAQVAIASRKARQQSARIKSEPKPETKPRPQPKPEAKSEPAPQTTPSPSTNEPTRQPANLPTGQHANLSPNPANPARTASSASPTNPDATPLPLSPVVNANSPHPANPLTPLSPLHR